jgi:hypothetical protein
MNALLFAESDGAGALAAGVFLCFGLAIYFIPGLIAMMRGHQNAAAIFILNLLLGWTFLGWAIALVWAFTAVEKRGD